MVSYQDFRIRLQLLSPLGTRMTSDTLFGHLCWQVAYRQGPDGVAEFLRPFRQGQPPFVLSDAFPAGLLPKPPVPRTPSALARPEDYPQLKQWQKWPFLTVDDFLRLREDPSANVQPLPDPWQVAKIPHAAIDRRIDTTGTEAFAGQFFLTEVCYLPGKQIVDIYCRDFTRSLPSLLQWLEQIGKTGFGRDKSVGFGQFRILSEEPWPHFSPLPGANAVISLSTLVPAKDDPTHGFWQLRVKHGFLGEQASANPFKRPMLQLEPGAIFACPDNIPPFLGRIVPGVAPGMPEAVQCGLALTVPCRQHELL